MSGGDLAPYRARHARSHPRRVILQQPAEYKIMNWLAVIALATVIGAACALGAFVSILALLP